jgi:hypothetical protein
MDLTGTDIKLGADNHYYGTIEEIKKLLEKKGLRFKSGGYTGNYEGLAYVDPHEWIVPKVDTANLLKAIDITRGMETFINKFNPTSLNNLKQNAVQISAVTNVYASDGMDVNQLSKVIETNVYNNIANRMVTKGY